MKYLFTALWGIICVVILLLGQLHWSARTAVKASTTKEIETTVNPKPDETNYLAMTRNWPVTAQGQFKQSLKDKKPFKILLVGSSALGTSEKGWAADIASKLKKAYGSKKIEVEIDSYNLTSTEFIAENKQNVLANEKAGMILLEPFLLNDNGKVVIDDSLKNISKFIEEVKAKNPSTSIILQPSYPLYGAKFYPEQVNQLQKYAKEKQVAYLNHWTAWPNTNDVHLKDYLLTDESGPSEKGLNVWEKYVLNFFIAKSLE